MEAKTKSERFVQARKDMWESLRLTLLKISKRGLSSLKEQEAAEFPRLYRMVCTDLAEAKMLKLSPDVLFYLNDMIGQAHKHLYSFPPLKMSSIKEFFQISLPQIALKNWVFVIIAAVTFLVPYVISFAIIVNDPESAKELIPENVLNKLASAYKEGFTEERSTSSKGFMVSYYIYNNVSIDFACFALGMLLGIGTLYILIYNGIALGAISGYIYGIGYGDNFIHFVTAHSVFELTGLILSGASGLLLGYSIINARKYSRRDWLKLQKTNLFTLVAAAALLTFLAAFIEGIISPSLLPYSFKAVVAIVSFAFVILYFFIIPIFTKRSIKI